MIVWPISSLIKVGGNWECHDIGNDVATKSIMADSFDILRIATISPIFVQIGDIVCLSGIRLHYLASQD